MDKFRVYMQVVQTVQFSWLSKEVVSCTQQRPLSVFMLRGSPLPPGRKDPAMFETG